MYKSDTAYVPLVNFGYTSTSHKHSFIHSFIHSYSAKLMVCKLSMTVLPSCLVFHSELQKGYTWRHD